jgi:hypothetical protein
MTRSSEDSIIEKLNKDTLAHSRSSITVSRLKNTLYKVEEELIGRMGISQVDEPGTTDRRCQAIAR